MTTATLDLLDLQTAYDSSAAGRIVVDATRGAVSIRDNATPLGSDLFTIEDNAGTHFVAAAETTFELGLETRRHMLVDYGAPGSRGGIRHLPDDYTQTVSPSVTYALQWDSTVTTNVAGGGGIGNDTAPAMVGAIGTCIFADQGNLFSSALLFNQGTTLQLQANIGPVYTMVNQPTILADGGSHTCSQHNALRIQPRWGPNVNAGSITQTSAVYIFNSATVDATVGSAAVTALTYWAALNPILTAGGTVGTFVALDIEDITTPSTIFGLRSAMSSGTFISHTGAAVSSFAGTLHVTNAVALNLGGVGSNGVQLLRSAAGVMQMVGVNGTNDAELFWNFDPATAGVVEILNTSDRLQINVPALVFGTLAPTNNDRHVAFVAPARTIPAGSDASNCLNSAGGTITFSGLVTTWAQWIVNAATTAGTAPTNAANMVIQTSVAQGVNRYGLLITSNPGTGGGGVGAALRVTAGLSRFDGRVDINNPIALGAGAAATLGLIGGSGPAAAAQSQWVEIDVGGTPHWIPVWV